MLTPRPRPRKDGTVNWQVPYHYYDTDGVRRRTAESFGEDYAEAAWWCDYEDRYGLDQALTILDAKRGSSGSTVRLADWLTDHADRLLKIRSISSPVHRKYLGYIRNDINPFYGEGAAIDVVTQDTDAAWIVFLEQDKGNAPKTIKKQARIPVQRSARSGRTASRTTAAVQSVRRCPAADRSRRREGHLRQPRVGAVRGTDHRALASTGRVRTRVDGATIGGRRTARTRCASGHGCGPHCQGVKRRRLAADPG